MDAGDGDGFEVATSRVLAATPAAVFGAFSNPEHLKRWWGPAGFTNTFERFDLRPGGVWRFVMRGPDGREYPNAKEFLEVVPSERIVLRNMDPTHGFLLTITLAARGGGTELTWRMVFEPAPGNGRIRDVVAAANEENLDRLAACLATM